MFNHLSPIQRLIKYSNLLMKIYAVFLSYLSVRCCTSLRYLAGKVSQSKNCNIMLILALRHSISLLPVCLTNTNCNDRGTGSQVGNSSHQPYTLHIWKHRANSWNILQYKVTPVHPQFPGKGDDATKLCISVAQSPQHRLNSTQYDCHQHIRTRYASLNVLEYTE